jgi:hypothetical protein
MVRAKIDAAYADSVKFAPEVDAFDEAISAAVKVCGCGDVCVRLLWGGRPTDQPTNQPINQPQPI